MMKLKKLLSISLAIIMILGMPLSTLKASALASINDTPVVYVVGKGLALYDEDENQIYPLKKSALEAVKENLSAIGVELAKSLITDNWDGYCDAIVDTIAPVHSQIILNDDGEVDNSTHCKAQNPPTRKTANFALSEYMFVYDWRLDPFETAKQLNAYIDDVLAATGKQKVNLIGRCYGSNILSAYFHEYGYDKVTHCLLYVPTAMGTKLAGAMFSGSIELNPDIVEKYLYSAVDYEGDPLMAMLTALVTVLNEVKALGLATELVEKIYDKVKENVIPRLVLSIYGTMPSYWAMINDEYYEKAKETVFGDNTQQYAKLIEKIDNYHINIMQNVEDIYIRAQESGVRISLVCKYNVPYVPIIEGASIMADDSVETVLSSFGATCADYTQTLSPDYINKKTVEGDGRYISKDKKIDASTCTYADTTWFIRDIKHAAFVNSLNELIVEIFNTSMTVHDNEKYPQFMLWDKSSDTLKPIVNQDSRDGLWERSSVEKYINLLIKFIKYISSLFADAQ